MIDEYLDTCLSRYDLKLVYNILEGTDINKKKAKLLCPTLSQIKIVLSLKGYKLYTYRYICPKNRIIKSYYTIK